MTTAALIKSLKPGELVIRCADGSLLRTMTNDFHAAHERPVTLRKLMRKLTALKKQARKR
jgi:hypothetical protein